MPRGPDRQKRPTDVIGTAVMVGKIATGEAEEEGNYVASKSERASAGGKARAQHLSKGERQSIAKAGAKARWNEERRANMTNKEHLMAALFGNPQREHVDLKFFVLPAMDLTVDKLCEDAVAMLEHMDSTEGECDFSESFEQREVSEFIASL